MGSDHRRCGSSLLLSLPDDVLSLVSTHLTPRDLASLCLCSRGLDAAVSSSDKIWLPQCLRLLPSPTLLSSWRGGVSSHRSLCRFLSSVVSPLLGIWVHQNPELGNVVCVLPGPCLSLIACRIIPQELNPRGTHTGLDLGPLLWAPVFEIISASPDGSESHLFLHGRGGEDEEDSLYPGSVGSVDPNCNVLLLEVDAAAAEPVRFSRLAFGDRRRLLDLVAGRVRRPDLETAPLFPAAGLPAEERRLKLINMHEVSDGGRVDLRMPEFLGSDEYSGIEYTRKKRSFFSTVKKMIGMSRSPIASSLGIGESKHVPLDEFLRAGETVGLSLRATNMRLTTYRAWPNMHDNRFALYKLPLQEPASGKEYAGLWGGTFGWPPGKASLDKPGKALFFLLLSYEEVEGQLVLIATKILEGTHYVLHPNGSAMFIVKVNEPALELFPWETDGEDVRVEVKHAYAGEGIANGYGFRYPGSKPGSLFEIQNGLLSFVWKESKAVLTLQRLDLEELLKKGEQVPPLPPIANFAYLTKSYSNVFTGFPSNSSCSPSPRC